ncbi:MAG: DUF192 domain-containing protein [Nanoarchaeota archaeon]
MKFNLNNHNLIFCTSFFSKFKGLMFSKKKNLVLILKKESKFNAVIHMFFVFFPIDVFWLDKDKNIVDFRKRVMPFTIAVPKKKAKYIVEISKY